SSRLMPAVPAKAIPPAGRTLPLKCKRSLPSACTSMCQIRSRNRAGANCSMPSGCSRTCPSASTMGGALGADIAFLLRDVDHKTEYAQRKVSRARDLHLVGDGPVAARPEDVHHRLGAQHGAKERAPAVGAAPSCRREPVGG